MAEYIELKPLTGAHNAMADEIEERGTNFNSTGAAHFLRGISKRLFNFCTADVAPVIRCKDCIYYEPYDPEVANQEFTCTNDYGLDVPEDDDFCSHAKRRADNDRVH